MEARFEVELAAALLEKVLETLAEQVHDHNVVGLAVVGLLIADEVQEWHVSFATQFVNQLALPEEHDVALSFNRFFLHKSPQKVTVSKSSASSIFFLVKAIKVSKSERFCQPEMPLAGE